MPTVEPQLDARDLAPMLGSWRNTRATLSIGLATAIAHLIESEHLHSGLRLPAQRALAAELEVARGTITTAYEILAGGGYVIAEVGRGSTISPMNKRTLRPPGDPAQPAGAIPVAVDLSTQSLPASAALTSVLDHVTPAALRPYLETDGHTSFGLSVLRSAVARHLTVAGNPTVPEQVLITSGAQQAMWLVVFTFTGEGDTVLVEDPTYRGILASLVGVRRDLAVATFPAELAEFALPRRLRPSLAYLQSSVHSPTGTVRSAEQLRAFAEQVADTDALVIEDRSTEDLIYDPAQQNSGLSGLLDPERLCTVGTMSKLYWGGLRIGWIRSDPRTIGRLADAKQAIDVTTSVLDQFVAAEALQKAPEAIAERRGLLLDHLGTTQQIVREMRPAWKIHAPAGGSGLWIDTTEDSIEFTMKAQSRGIRIADGPLFSARHGFGTHIRLPVWCEPSQLRHALRSID